MPATAAADPEVQRALNETVGRALRSLTLALLVLFLLFIPGDAFSLPGKAGLIVPVLDAIFAVVVGLLYIAIRRGRLPSRFAQPAAALVMACTLGYLWAVFAITADPIQTSGQALWVIFVGIFFLSWPWTLFLTAAANVGWLVIVLSLPPSGEWVQYGTLLVSASVISLVAHSVRLKTYRNLEGLRLADARRQRELEAALVQAKSGQQAERSAQLRTRFINDAAHQLSTPLTPLVIHAHLLRERGDLSPDLRKTADAIGRSVERLRSIVEKILEGANLDAGLLRVEKKPFNLLAIARDAVADVQPAAAAAGVALGGVPGGLVLATGDAARMGEVLRQLLSNAIQATPKGGRIVVGVRREGENAIVDVTDTGRGLTAEEIPQLFLAFTKIEGVPDSNGYGLGLYVAAGLVRRMGGILTCRSEGPGKGSTFTVRLQTPAVSSTKGV